MKNLILILVAMMIFIGCSKDGAKSRLLDGPQVSESQTPTDVNYPELGPKSTGS